MKLLPKNLRMSVVVVTGLATLVAAAGMGIAHYQTQKRNSRSNLARLLVLSASESATRVARWLDDRRSSASNLADSTTLIAELRRLRQFEPQDMEYFLSLYRLKRELDLNTLSHPYIHAITIHDPETGQVLLASTGKDVEVATVDTDDRGVAQARDKLWVSPMFPAEILLPDESNAPSQNVPCLFIAAPVREGNDLYGVLRIRAKVIDIGENLMRASNFSSMFGTSDVFVVSREGVLLSPSHFERELKAAGKVQERSMLDLKLVAPDGKFTRAFQQSRLLLDRSGSESNSNVDGYQSVRGNQVVGAWERVEGTDWVCVAEIDHAEAFAPLAAITRTNWILTLVIGAFVVTLTAWLASHVVAPLHQLTTVATQLAAGDRSVRCDIDRQDEIGKLAVAFNHMADSVHSSLSELEENATILAHSNEQLESELKERQRAEQQLRTTNAFLDSVIDNIPTMLFMKNADDLRFVRFNKAGEEVVGCSREELIGKTDFDLYPREEAESFVRNDRAVLNSLKMIEIEEEELMTERGLRILHTKKIPICDEYGLPQMLLGISEDITDKKAVLEQLKAAKEAAEAADRSKSDFLANMSHEIRTPMNAIIGMTDLVLDTSLDKTQRDYLSIVGDSAESLLSIINQILDFSKIEAGKMELEEVDFDVREEVGDTLKSLGVRAGGKQIELAWTLQSDVPRWLRGDPVRLRQMLVNLVGNAIKFTEEGEVTVEVKRKSECESEVGLHFIIRDTGVGIPLEKQAKIFSAFEQADTSTTREFGGTGLGLAITVRIAEAMGGTVWVESVPGEGSEFHFTACFVPGIAQQEPEEIPHFDDVEVLVVDDNATNRQIVERILNGWGIPVKTAASGGEALELIRTRDMANPPPVVISDVNMPQMDGFEFAQQLRNTDCFRDGEIIMLTSGGRPGELKLCEELKISSHLMKPVKHSELLQSLLIAVGRQHETRRAPKSSEVDPAAQTLPRLRILLAEDGVANQKVAVGLLSKWGHEVTIAENGEVAVEMWQAGNYDLILMDVQMPVMDGLAATERIRELEGNGSHTPIIAMTARAMKGDRERCLEVGMDDYVSKPVRKPELYRALSSLIRSENA